MPAALRFSIRGVASNLRQPEHHPRYVLFPRTRCTCRASRKTSRPSARRLRRPGPSALRLALLWRKQPLLRLASAPKTKSASPNQASGSVEAERASEPVDFDELFFLRALFLCERFDLRCSELATFV